MAVETAARALEGDTGRTMVALWEGARSRTGAPAFLVNESRGVWREVGWDEAAGRVDELAAGFLALGIAKSDRVAILSNTRLEWSLTDYALLSLGVIVVPIYQTSSRDETAYVLRDAGARAVVCEDAEQLAKVRGLDLPELQLTIAFEDAGEDALSLDHVGELGRARLAENGAPELAAARASVSPDDPLTLIYTSGTTGDPKGCILTHRDWCALVESVKQVDGLMASGDVAVLFLPLAHNFARLVQFMGAGAGLTLALVPDITRVARALEEVKPTVFPSVPRLFERVYDTVHKRLTQEEGVKGVIARRALAAGLRGSRIRQQGKRPWPLLALQLRLADRLVFSKIKDRFGGRLKHAVSGGAALAPHMIEFFDACGVLILEGYGLTETTSACAVNRPDRYRFGTVGPALPGIEIALADDGEIKIRGETLFQGYYGRPEATGEVLTDDGWLLTGDIGTIDADGFVTIVDRKKELIVTSGGKNISPFNLETALKAASPLIANALVVGDGRTHLAALVYADPEEAAKAGTDEDGVRAAVQAAVDQVNAGRGPVEHIKRFALLPRDFSAEEGEVTPTLKLKRRVCEAHFAQQIESLYDRGGRGCKSTAGREAASLGVLRDEHPLPRMLILRGKLVRIIDLSVPITEAGGEPLPPKIRYRGHKAGTLLLSLAPAQDKRSKARSLRNVVRGLVTGKRVRRGNFPDGVGLAWEDLKTQTHHGTHVDAPWHYGPTSEGKPARTIDELPLDWFIGPGVRIDLREHPAGTLLGVEDLQAALAAIGHTLGQGEIVLLWTGADELFLEPEYLERYSGLGAESTRWLLDQGVRVIGTDAWSLDRPPLYMGRDFVATGDPSHLWPAHFVGREREYCQIEKLANLGALPAPTGFTVVCFPVKIERASAGWTRAVALLENGG